MSSTASQTHENDAQRQARGIPKLMTHAERQRLIRRPFIFTIIQPRPWAGVLIREPNPALAGEDFATTGGGAFNPLPLLSYANDETFLRYGSPDDVDRDLDNLY